MRANFAKTQSMPEMGLGTSGSMHRSLDGYGSGALAVDMLKADKTAHRVFKDEFRTTSSANFNATMENSNAGDRRRARLARRTPRRDNLKTSTGDIGSFDSARKDLFTPDTRLMRVSKKSGKSLSSEFTEPRPENWFLSSADYGSLRAGERAQQPHQEPREACLYTDRRHPCKQFKMRPVLVGKRHHRRNNHHRPSPT